MTDSERLQELYKDHAQLPYIGPDRDLAVWLLEGKPVPKRNMERLDNGLLAGDIILLWRIGFGTFTTDSFFPKYFEFTYGINASAHLAALVDQGYAYKEKAFASLDHINAAAKKAILKSKKVNGLSKMKAADLDRALAENFTEEELAQSFSVRGYELTEKGRQALAAHQEVVDRHPQKKF
ncbi:hypothetical protein ACVRXQ_07735 [Streptococcus panodentis]|uniref:Uncharacterized protein n=1 Tax=Streptococcus panodentis TaxID=1581472 RepID=A0ABS5AYL5_9STRE|nr:hypothetical protein [Streptococcus panodentis]MBP2621669.1 hypothetical protein [Streptococcus panodentis]